MTTNKFTVVAILATLILVSTALAQRGDGGGQQRGGQRGGQRGEYTGGQRGFGGGQRTQSEVQLLARPDVQTELKITDEQKTKLTALAAEMTESFTDLFPSRGGERGTTGGDAGGTRRGGRGTGGGDAGTRGGDRGNFDFTAIQTDMAKITKEANTKAKVILTDAQWKRLGEIKVQMMGTRAVFDEEIKKKLGLKATQNRDINTLNESLSSANQAIYAKMRDPNIDRESLQKELDGNNKIFDQELAKILTAAQKKMLDSMKGKPFKQDMEYRPERGGFAGRGGRGGGGDGGGRSGRGGGGTGGG